MKTEPIVSIVIPVYNGGNFLKYAIESALSQTYKKCEVIVVNDGSTDQGVTEKIAKSYGTRIKYVKQDNGGTASALNHGIRIMNGDYFVWLSHDDVLRSYKAEAQLRAIRESGNAQTIAQGNYSFINEATGGVVTTRFHQYYPMETINRGGFLFLWGETHFSNLLFSCEHFDRVGKFNEKAKTTQDQDMQFRLLRGQKTVFVSEPVSTFRLHGESESIKNKKLMFEENRRLYLYMLKCFQKSEIEGTATRAGVFYAHIASIVHSMGGGIELPEIEDMLKNEVDHIANNEVSNLLIDMKERGIVIFGAGAYGRRVLYELESRGISPLAFVDNSSLKQGSRIDGLLCYSVKDLFKMGCPYVIIGQKSYADAWQQLKAAGYKFLMLKDELDSILWKISPIKVPKWEV